MSSPSEGSNNVFAASSSFQDEGGHSSWIEQPSHDPSDNTLTSHDHAPPAFTSRAASSSRLHTHPRPMSLPHRHLSTQTLGRSARSSPRNSTDSFPRRPPLVDRVTSSRSLFLPAINYSSSQQPDDRDDWRSTAVGSTPLDRTMDRIGMGRYQWTVLILSGLGWAADNMWIQAIAIVLPHLQRYFTLSDGIVGLASSSIFVGMFLGSIAWGTISDSYGRRAAFNITLAVTAIFGSLSAMASSFPLLCLLLLAVGTGVGGSMPTDSSNLVENLPVRKHSYVTALSVFFSAGSVVSSLIGLLVLSASDPDGWRWLLGALAFVTVLFVSARVVFFRLLESPKYLVHSGRPQEARDILQRIHRYNGGATISLRIQDVVDDSGSDRRRAGQDMESSQHSMHQHPSRNSAGVSQKRTNVAANDERVQDSYTEDEEDEADISGQAATRPLLGDSTAAADETDDAPKSDQCDTSVHIRNDDSAISQPPSLNHDLPPSLSWLPKSWHPSAADLASRYTEMFSSEWKRTTILIWIIWGGMSYGFTTFNVLLPKYLERGYDPSPSSASNPTEPDDATIRRALIDILLYSLSSLPGSLISAYMVETKLGRIGTMAVSTAVMAASVALFSATLWRSSLTVVSISSSISYAAIYGYTPEVMAPTIRATACGTASAISRIAGIVAPILAGWAYSLAPPIPLFLAATVLAIVTFAMAVLPIETRGRAADASRADDGGGTNVH